MIGRSRFRALARPDRSLCNICAQLTVAVSLTAISAFAQDSSVAVERPLRVVGGDGRTQIVEVNNEARRRLAAGLSVAELTSVPLANGQLVDFALERFEVFKPGAELAVTDGTTTAPVAPPKVVYYRGFGISDPDETVFLSVSQDDDGELYMLSSHPKRGTSVIAPDRDASGRTILRLSRGGDAGLEPFTCGTDSLLQAQDAIQNLVEPDELFHPRNGLTLEAELVVDVSNYLYVNIFGSNSSKAVTYVGNLIGACSAIYQRDLGVVLKVKLAHVWTTAEPFDGLSTNDQLSRYVSWNKANRSGVSRDLAHYLGGRRSLGGIAYLGGLCSTNYGYGVSNIHGTYTYPTSSYTWDVNCVSHELGHNFNSPHTHCYSPPIDCCYANECACGTPTPDPGTIMSYCHLLNGGAGVGMYFHSRCVGVMRTYAETRSCLTLASGGDTGGKPSISVQGNGKPIPNGDYTPSSVDGTNFGSSKLSQGTVRTFSIRNTGNGNLSLISGWLVLMTGPNASEFTVTAQPPVSIAPGATATFQITFRPTAIGVRSALVNITSNDPLIPTYRFWVEGSGMLSETFASASGWIPSDGDMPGMCVTEVDTGAQALKVRVSPHPVQPRVLGWMSNGSSSGMPYVHVGPTRYVRAKFHVYAGGQPGGDVNRIPNLRLRVGNRFAVASVLEVLHHSKSDPESSRLGFDFRPSWDPNRPSVYRVDFDPIDVPYLLSNATSEYITRMFEAYALEPQEEGYVALTESSLMAYPALPDDGIQISKLYAPERQDFSGTHFTTYNIQKPVTWPPSVQTSGSDLPRGSNSSRVVELDTLRVPSTKMGVAAADILPGAASEDHDPTRRIRVAENQLYKIRFHASSAQATSRQAQIRFRARTAKFAWVQKLEVGGAWATGTDPNTGNAAIAQQSLPGIGSKNPDKIASGDAGAWYTMLFHSPMSRDIRADYGNVPLSTSMPNISSQDPPGVNNGKTRRDIVLGIDLIDTFSPGPNAHLEQGHVILDRVEIRTYYRGDD